MLKTNFRVIFLDAWIGSLHFPLFLLEKFASGFDVTLPDRLPGTVYRYTPGATVTRCRSACKDLTSSYSLRSPVPRIGAKGTLPSLATAVAEKQAKPGVDTKLKLSSRKSQINCIGFFSEIDSGRAAN